MGIIDLGINSLYPSTTSKHKQWQSKIELTNTIRWIDCQRKFLPFTAWDGYIEIQNIKDEYSKEIFEYIKEFVNEQNFDFQVHIWFADADAASWVSVQHAHNIDDAFTQDARCWFRSKEDAMLIMLAFGGEQD